MRNIHLSIVSMFVIVAAVMSGCKTASIEEGHKAYDTRRYADAAEIYKEVLGEQPKESKGELTFKVAECYRLYNSYKNAERWYERAEKANYGPEATKMRAEMLKRQGMYTEAIIMFNKYLETNPEDAEAKRWKEGAELALKWMQPGECVLFKVENVKKLNTRDSDHSVALLKKESIIFTSDRPEGVNKNLYGWTGAGYFDLWEASLTKRRGEVTINSPSLLEGSANTKYNDGSPALNSKGSSMYFTQCGGLDGKSTTCALYVSNKMGKTWGDPVMLDFCDTSYTYGHPTLSADGKRLYFTSDMPGGHGGLDIWMVTEVGRGKTWSPPLNIGPTINTSGDEMYPSLHADGTLFFSSTGHTGMGGLDIYKSTGTGEEWSTPENMKHPINSSGDDFSIVFKDDNQSGYFSSNRPGGRGGDDIWEFYPVPQNYNLTGYVRDCNTGLPITDAAVFVSNDMDSNKFILRTDRNGFFKYPLAKEVKYELYSDKNEDFYIESQKEFVSTKSQICSKDYVQDFVMCRLPIETMFNVRGILYDLDRANIRPDAAKILDDSVVALMKRFPTITIELGSHTDCRATHEYNRELAQRRADSAVAYIISKGIDSARLTAKGYGEDSLQIAKCKCDQSDYQNICTEWEHQQNRRTTVRVTSTNYLTDAMKKQREEQRRLEEQRRAPAPQAAPATPDDREAERQRKAEERERKKKEKEEERKKKAEERKKEQERKKKEREDKMKDRKKKKDDE